MHILRGVLIAMVMFGVAEALGLGLLVTLEMLGAVCGQRLGGLAWPRRALSPARLSELAFLLVQALVLVASFDIGIALAATSAQPAIDPTPVFKMAFWILGPVMVVVTILAGLVRIDPSVQTTLGSDRCRLLDAIEAVQVLEPERAGPEVVSAAPRPLVRPSRG